MKRHILVSLDDAVEQYTGAGQHDAERHFRAYSYVMGRVDEVLAEMRRERERLAAELARVDRVIAALEEPARAVDREAAATPAAPPAQAKWPPGVGPYTLLDIYQATARYLSTVDKPKNSTEIAAALRAGGFKTRSKNFVNTVRVMLRRRDGRSTGISVTSDGKRWFIRRKSTNRAAKKPSPAG